MHILFKKQTNKQNQKQQQQQQQQANKKQNVDDFETQHKNVNIW